MTCGQGISSRGEHFFILCVWSANAHNTPNGSLEAVGTPLRVLMSAVLLDRVHVPPPLSDYHHGRPVRWRGHHGGRLTDVNRHVCGEPRERQDHLVARPHLRLSLRIGRRYTSNYGLRSLLLGLPQVRQPVKVFLATAVPLFFTSSVLFMGCDLQSIL